MTSGCSLRKGWLEIVRTGAGEPPAAADRGPEDSELTDIAPRTCILPAPGPAAPAAFLPSSPSAGPPKRGESRPESRAPSAGPVRAPRRHAPSGRMLKLPSTRILVIDDEPGVAMALKRMLRHHEVSIALSGREALALVSSQTFDVILSDVMMPAPTGLDLYRQLASERSPLVARFVFISGGGHDAASRAFLRAIPNVCLEKPADSFELEQAVANVLYATGALQSLHSR